MKVEHISMSGKSVVRETDDVSPSIVELLRPFEIERGEVTLRYPNYNFDVEIASADDGALFTLGRNGQHAIVNFCSFDASQGDVMMVAVNDILDGRGIPVSMRALPKTGVFLYSIIVNPRGLSMIDSMLAEPVEFSMIDSMKAGLETFSMKDFMKAGSVEFYIYNSLYRGWLRGGGK